MSDANSTPEELILAMLRDVLARQAQQMDLRAQQTARAPIAPTVLMPLRREPDSPIVARTESPSAPREPAVATKSTDEWSETDEPHPLSPAEEQMLKEFNDEAARPLTPSNLPRLLRGLVLALLLLLLVANAPLFEGNSLARALSDQQSLIIRDGLLLKGSAPDVYVIERSQKRWISSLNVFEVYRYQWADVHMVDDQFLNQFPNGKPLYLLVKCPTSPHVYRIENERKRWIKDIPTLLSEGHQWQDVRDMPCAQLRAIPDGAPIPPDAGTPPQP